jgi:hypothetical protein
MGKKPAIVFVHLPSALDTHEKMHGMLRTASDVRMTSYDIRQKNCAPGGVTFGVTWGLQGFASESYSGRAMSEAQRLAALAKLMVGERHDDGLRGKFAEIIFSPTGREAPKSLKNMVGTTGIEPVTPTMSR